MQKCSSCVQNVFKISGRQCIDESFLIELVIAEAHQTTPSGAAQEVSALGFVALVLRRRWRIFSSFSTTSLVRFLLPKIAYGLESLG